MSAGCPDLQHIMLCFLVFSGIEGGQPEFTAHINHIHYKGLWASSASCSNLQHINLVALQTDQRRGTSVASKRWQWFSKSCFLGSQLPRGARKPFQQVGGEAPHLLESSPGPLKELGPRKQRIRKPCPSWGVVCSKLPHMGPGFRVALSSAISTRLSPKQSSIPHAKNRPNSKFNRKMKLVCYTGLASK